jgi:hypothetical protein
MFFLDHIYADDIGALPRTGLCASFKRAVRPSSGCFQSCKKRETTSYARIDLDRILLYRDLDVIVCAIVAADVPSSAGPYFVGRLCLCIGSHRTSSGYQGRVLQ